jgi:hypothetical protein
LTALSPCTPLFSFLGDEGGRLKRRFGKKICCIPVPRTCEYDININKTKKKEKIISVEPMKHEILRSEQAIGKRLDQRLYTGLCPLATRRTIYIQKRAKQKDVKLPPFQ